MHALCVMHAPDLFDLDEEGHARVLADPVPADLDAEARAAEGGCPEAAANADPAAFPDPRTVDFARPHNAHVGFAAGPHRCLGSNLARLELRLAIEEFHRRIPDYQITPGDKVVYTNYGVRAAIRLPVTFPVSGDRAHAKGDTI